mmetsp:Transcript_80936/g.99139  ORF Transcript_80936/g.99139 Transcript_80936/m.99139 type:complete len:154 (-) Transcript_80936:72-533(-)
MAKVIGDVSPIDASKIKPLQEISLQILKKGDGKHFPKKGQKVTMYYKGTFYGGKKHGECFDENSKENPKYYEMRHINQGYPKSLLGKERPFSTQIGVGAVINGWDVGVMKLSLGAKAIILIPYKDAYGKDGYPQAGIPPKQDMQFVVELLKIE